MKLIECVPNFSEGRDPDVLQKIRGCFDRGGVRLLDFSADTDHNRSVATVVGEPIDVIRAVLDAVGAAARNIDLTVHDGEHPCIGATDVVPFVPIRGCDMNDAIDAACAAAEGIAVAYEIPTFLYAEAARRPQCINLADVRRGGFGALAERLKTLDYMPDFGPMRPHPTAGATAVGARKFLVAYNVDLETKDVSAAKAIARRVRERDGGLPCVKALGVYLASSGIAQVTMNLTDYTVTSPRAAYLRVCETAKESGVSVRGGELIGLVPAAAVSGVSGKDLGLNVNLDDRIIENLLARG